MGTALIALVAAAIALRSLSRQKSIARKRAAIDFFLKTEMDQEMRQLYTRFKAALCAIDPALSVQEFAAGSHYSLYASSLFGVGGNDRSCLSTDVFRFG